nr:unnamed protein product [Callosobruchus analis]
MRHFRKNRFPSSHQRISTPSRTLLYIRNPLRLFHYLVSK